MRTRSGQEQRARLPCAILLRRAILLRAPQERCAPRERAARCRDVAVVLAVRPGSAGMTRTAFGDPCGGAGAVALVSSDRRAGELNLRDFGARKAKSVLRLPRYAWYATLPTREHPRASCSCSVHACGGSSLPFVHRMLAGLLLPLHMPLHVPLKLGRLLDPSLPRCRDVERELRAFPLDVRCRARARRTRRALCRCAALQLTRLLQQFTVPALLARRLHPLLSLLYRGARIERRLGSGSGSDQRQ